MSGARAPYHQDSWRPGPATKPRQTNMRDDFDSRDQRQQGSAARYSDAGREDRREWRSQERGYYGDQAQRGGYQERGDRDGYMRLANGTGGKSDYARAYYRSSDDSRSRGIGSGGWTHSASYQHDAQRLYSGTGAHEHGQARHDHRGYRSQADADDWRRSAGPSSYGAYQDGGQRLYGTSYRHEPYDHRPGDGHHQDRRYHSNSSDETRGYEYDRQRSQRQDHWRDQPVSDHQQRDHQFQDPHHAADRYYTREYQYPSPADRSGTGSESPPPSRPRRRYTPSAACDRNSSSSSPEPYRPPHNVMPRTFGHASYNGRFGASYGGDSVTNGHRMSGNSTPTQYASDAQIPKGKKKKPTASIFLPSQEYIEISHPSRAYADNTQQAGNQPSTKLLVFDLNGALVYRSATKTSNRRPYLSNLLAYVFTAEPPIIPDQSQDMTGSVPPRALEAFVWSSAQPQNVRLMVDKAFGSTWTQDVWGERAGKLGVQEEREARRMRGEGRLLGVWARDKMRLPADQYNQHVQTVKDLRDLQAAIAQPHEIPADSDIHYRQYMFDERNTILLDDSTAKAVHQPWNHICLPEYDQAEHRASQVWALRRQGRAGPGESGHGSGMDVDAAERRSAADVDRSGELDEYLLCVVGILEELRAVENVPAWIRGGGLTRLPPGTPGSRGLESSSTPDAQAGYNAPTIGSLPSHATFRHWYAIPEVVAYWRGRGVEALERKGIKVDPDVDLTNLSTGHRMGAPIGGHAGDAGMNDRPPVAARTLESGYMSGNDGVAAKMMKLGMANGHIGPSGLNAAGGTGQADGKPEDHAAVSEKQLGGKKKRKQKKKAINGVKQHAGATAAGTEADPVNNPDAILIDDAAGYNSDTALSGTRQDSGPDPTTGLGGNANGKGASRIGSLAGERLPSGAGGVAGKTRRQRREEKRHAAIAATKERNATEGAVNAYFSSTTHTLAPLRMGFDDSVTSPGTVLRIGFDDHTPPLGTVSESGTGSAKIDEEAKQAEAVGEEQQLVKQAKKARQRAKKAAKKAQMAAMPVSLDGGMMDEE